MKLSADAKKHVAAQVAAAFAHKIKELEEELAAARKERDTFIKKVKDALEKFKQETVYPKLLKVLGGLGVLSSEVNLNDISCALRIGWAADNKYGICDIDSHDSDIEAAFDGCGSRVNNLNQELEALKTEIKSRVSYALYEIEIHGKKDTLETIIKQAIDIEVEKLAKQEEE